MKDKNKIVKSLIIMVIVILLVITGLFKCPIKTIFGLSCPFCGLTRALYNAINLNFKKAFYYHALWPIIIIFVVIHILLEFKVIKLNKKINYAGLYVLAITNLIYYFYRLFNNSGVVYFDFTKSLIYKIIRLFI